MRGAMPGRLEPARLAWNLTLQGWDLVFLSVSQDAPAPRPLMLPLGAGGCPECEGPAVDDCSDAASCFLGVGRGRLCPAPASGGSMCGADQTSVTPVS